MTTIKITLWLQGKKREVEVSYDGPYNHAIVCSLDIGRWNIDHLIDHQDIEEAILQHHLEGQEYLGEQQMELERGN